MGEKLNCCTKCFQDDFLKKYIQQVGKLGDCDYCGSLNRYGVDAGELRDKFLVLLDSYEEVAVGENTLPDDDPENYGDFLAAKLQEDWEMFSDKLDYGQMRNLLDNIYNSYLSPRELYSGDGVDVDSIWTNAEGNFAYRGPEEYWSSFAIYIKNDRRFVFEDDIVAGIADPIKWLPEYLEGTSIILKEGEKLYRARVGPNPQPYGSRSTWPKEEMGPPPREITPAGRANSKGIPVLYAASTEATAIAEVRAWKGAFVSVATLDINQDLRIADLSELPYLTESPFAYEESSELSSKLEEQRLLRRFAGELSRPIAPNEAEIEYLPTQYLTEIVQSSNFEGLLYPSAMGEGKNIVIFDYDRVRIVELRLIEIENVVFSYEIRGDNSD